MHEQHQDVKFNFILFLVLKTDISTSDTRLGKGAEEMYDIHILTLFLYKDIIVKLLPIIC